MFKKIIDLGFFYSLVFMAITFPLPYEISNLGILFLIIFWITTQFTSKNWFKFKYTHAYDRVIFFSFIALFLWNLTALIYTDDASNGWKTVEGKLSLLVLPIVFYSSSISQNAVIKLLKYYIYSIALCTIFLLSLSVNNYLQFGKFLSYHEFTSALDFHAVFYSYYIFLAVIASIYLFFKQYLNKFEKIVIAIAIILSIIGLIISASKNVLVVTTLFIVIGIVSQGIKNKIGLKEIAIALLFFGIATISISQIPVIKNRVAELVQLNGIENLEKIKKGEKIAEEDIYKFNGTSLRITFWYVGLNTLIDQNRLLIGLSPGDRREIINQKYYEVGLNPWFKNYNLHNQFIQVFIELGLIGLLIYLILHLFILLFGLYQNNLLLTAFISGLIFFQMTESVIERNKGIVFFCYFLLLIKQLSPTDEDRNIRD